MQVGYTHSVSPSICSSEGTHSRLPRSMCLWAWSTGHRREIVNCHIDIVDRHIAFVDRHIDIVDRHIAIVTSTSSHRHRHIARPPGPPYGSLPGLLWNNVQKVYLGLIDLWQTKSLTYLRNCCSTHTCAGFPCCANRAIPNY